MADIIDAAQEAEALARLEALNSMPVAELGTGPQIIDGKACCVDCDGEIQPARLKARPGCSRCTACQDEHERLERQFGRA